MVPSISLDGVDRSYPAAAIAGKNLIELQPTVVTYQKGNVLTTKIKYPWKIVSAGVI
jgi:hypothetical protein